MASANEQQQIFIRNETGKKNEKLPWAFYGRIVKRKNIYLA